MPGELQRLGAQRRHAGLVEQFQRGAQRRQSQHRRVAQLPALGAQLGHELRRHLEARGLLVAPPAGKARQRCIACVALVDEAAGHRAGAGIEVFVVAPHREVGGGVVQGQRHVADRVGEVEADVGALRACQPGDRVEVEHLPAAVLHTRPQHQRYALAVLGDGAFDGGHRDRAVGLVRLHFDQVGGWVEAVEADLRLDRVAVGGEGTGFHQDRRARGRGAVEADHHQLQVHAQRVHRHHFHRQRADHARQRIAHQPVVIHPVRRTGEVAFDRDPRPQVQDLLHHHLCATWLQAERVADEIGLVGAIVLRDQKLVAQLAQRIGRIKRDGMGRGQEFVHCCMGVKNDAAVYRRGMERRGDVSRDRILPTRPGRDSCRPYG
ncbi:hypothetical protein STPYR_10947 [uncultured Stenotrophomonas sp.]|uniref:Uncharacterized protein n=1 Tax=uncultured Stenotrophomonas sp. TaxID=165438 RepID=A0A1Y5Q7Z2_9GAMM|nr:hypothetical protein STPYR_10947 [uncultured Stenotrophomonas sp.]